jgi:hypothetical protein
LNDDTLKIHQDSKPRIPRLMIDHSTGGLCSAMNELSPQKRAENSRHFIGAISMASFFGLSGASQKFNPTWRQAFNRMAHPELADLRTEETRAGRLYSTFLAIAGEPKIFSSIGNPTYKQIFELVAYAEHFMSELERNPPQTDIKRLYVVPRKDTVACPKTLQLVADLQGGDTFSVKNYHNPLLESPDKFLRKMVEFALDQLGDKAEELPTAAARQYLADSREAKRERKWLEMLAGRSRKPAAPQQLTAA